MQAYSQEWGGLELGLHRAGHETYFLCEVDSAAKEVLSNRFPGVELVSDIQAIRQLPPDSDVIAAGFPCQDLSQAGKTAGIDGERSGLVRKLLDLLEHSSASWLLIENVPFMLQLQKGKAMDAITTELEKLGFKWAYRVMDSRAFGVPQRRERVYLLASREFDPRPCLLGSDSPVPTLKTPWTDYACGFYWTEGIRGLGWAVDAIPTLKGGSTIGIPSQPAIIFPDGLIGKPNIMDAEALQGFPSDWTLPAERVTKTGYRWKLVGNAVTVPAAEWIGNRLKSAEFLTYDDRWDFPMAKNKGWPKAAWSMGGERCESHASAYPLITPTLSLIEFLKHPVQPLSRKATAGFLARTKQSSLRFPSGFIERLDAHLATFQKVAA